MSEGVRAIANWWMGGSGLAPSGSIVVALSGVSTVNGVTYFQGISQPNIVLADAGGGTYSVTITHRPFAEVEGSISQTTYLIDGELP